MKSSGKEIINIEEAYERNIKTFLKKNGIDIKKISDGLINLKKILVICGPTCAGKSKIGIILAKLLYTDIISMDSMQVYRYMDTGTDKYNTGRYQIVQYMTDIFDPDKNLTVVEFKNLCDEIIKEKFFKLSRIPLLVGGSGLYIRSVVNGIDRVPDENRKIRNKLKEEIKKYGTLKYYLKLKELDSEYAEKISENDIRRIVRALEVYEVTGLPFSSFQKAWKNKNYSYNAILIGVKMGRETLYSRIEERVDSMFEKGLVEEVKALIDKEYGGCRSVSQAVGYKEVIKYIKGEITLEDCIAEVKKNTRRLAKKQITWFKTEPKINWIRADNYDNIFSLIGYIFKIINKELRNEEY